jgi:hypothetical protein
MSKPKTLLEDLCRHALSCGGQSIEVEYEDRQMLVSVRKGDLAFGVARFAESSRDAKELRENLYAARKKTLKTAIGGQVWNLKIEVYDSFGEDAFRVHINAAPKRDASVAPRFTQKQGQYLAFHLQLLEDPRTGARGSGPPAVLSHYAAVCSSDDHDARTKRSHRAHSRTGAIHQASRPPGASADTG